MAHLGTAVIDHHAAVSVNMQKSTRLIKVLGGKRNAKFNRGKCQSFFNDRAGGVEVTDRFAPCPVIAVAFEGFNERM